MNIKEIKKVIGNLFFVVALILSSLPSYAISRILTPRLDIAEDLTVIKIFDIHLGTVVDLNSNNGSTHTGSFIVNTSHGVSKNNLTGVIHYADGTSGKVKLISEPGFVVTLWVIPPTSVGEFNSNVFWSDPKCKILGSNDSSINQAETVCALGDGLTVTTEDSTSYIYIGGKLNLNPSHNAHTGDGGVAMTNEDNFLGNHVLHVAYN
ncbi:MAG: hypothetical protein HRU36_03185 [Rickettsiales bacterium]|nr:hypothetical protein [Rickettsiales bacterium]